jgi:hypothetical protein
MNRNLSIIEEHRDLASAYPILGILPGWYFRVRAVADGHYSGEGRDIHGRVVSFTEGSSSEEALSGVVRRAEQHGRFELVEGGGGNRQSS